jgi:ATP-dependent Clp protease ATP-binding subunit ClpA
VRQELERQVSRGDGRLGQEMQLTPRAKRVIDLAYEQARILDNNYIGTEHLLLGLIVEREGIANKVLIRCGATYEAVFEDVKKLQDSKSTEKSSQKFMRYAQEEAAKRDDPVIKPEHLLIGLLREENSVHRILKTLNVSPDDLRNEAEKIVGEGDGIIGKKVDLHKSTKKIVESAYQFAKEHYSEHIGSAHLLFAIANDESSAGMLLRDRGVSPQRVRDVIRNDPQFQRPAKRKFVTMKTSDGSVTVPMDEVKSFSITGGFGTLEGELVGIEEREIPPEGD